MGTEITATATVEDGLEATRYAMVDTDEGLEVGYLLVHASGLILNVEVVEDRRGEGIAHALLEHADAAVRAATAQSHGLYHVPSWGRTPRARASPAPWAATPWTTSRPPPSSAWT